MNRKLWLNIIMIIMLSACLSDNEPAAEVELTPVLTKRSTPTLTSMPMTMTSTPVILATNTDTPDPTPTPTITPEPTQTSIPAWVPKAIPQGTITFSTNALAELSGVIISFQQPRSWQTSYFSDSGFSGLLVSNTDPNQAFWYAFRTGEEIVLIILPVLDTSNLRDLPLGVEVNELESEKGIAHYATLNGRIQGNIVENDIAFEILGEFPSEKEADFEEGIQMIFASFAWEPLGNRDFSDVWLLGTRHEGQIEVGDTAVGYVPLASSSEWTLTGMENQDFSLTIDTHDPTVTFALDLVNENGESLLPDGASSFTGSITKNHIKIPANGHYRIQVSASTGFRKYGPWDPASEAKTYGWYEITLK